MTGCAGCPNSCFTLTTRKEDTAVPDDSEFSMHHMYVDAEGNVWTYSTELTGHARPWYYISDADASLSTDSYAEPPAHYGPFIELDPDVAAIVRRALQ
jgi:hypothetical protein